MSDDRDEIIDDIGDMIDDLGERVISALADAEHTRLDALTGAPRGHHALMAAVASALCGDDPKSIAQRRRQLADDEALAATLGVDFAELPARPVALDLRVYSVDDTGERTQIVAAPDAVERFNALVDALPDPSSADAWTRRTRSEASFLEGEQ